MIVYKAALNFKHKGRIYFDTVKANAVATLGRKDYFAILFFSWGEQGGFACAIVDF